MRPSSRMSSRSRASASMAAISSPRLERTSVSEGMIWEDIAGYSRNLPGLARGDEPVALDLGALFRLVMIGEIRIVRDPRIDLADLTLRQAIAILAEKAQFDAIEDLADGARFPQRVVGIGESQRAGFGAAVIFIDH